MLLFCTVACCFILFLCAPQLVEARVGVYGSGSPNHSDLSMEQQLLEKVPAVEVLRPGSWDNETNGTLPRLWSYHFLPVFLQAEAPLLDVELLRPVVGRRPIPSSITRLLVPPFNLWHGSMAPVQNPKGVEVWCGSNKLSVRVNKQLLGFRSVSSMIYLGTCGVTQSTKNYHYFQYSLNQCGTKRMTMNGHLVYSNMLRYSPEVDGPVMRAQPLSLSIQCHYNRFHYTYKVGYLPEVNKSTLFKSLKSKRTFKLIAYNARWESPLANEGFVLGEPIYFEASTNFIAKNEQVFVNSCYASPSKKPASMPRVDVIKNFGCMVDSKRRRSRSKFLSYKMNVLRFTIDAFAFPNISAKHLYLHCSIAVGKRAVTQSAKSCNFNRKSKSWEELHGPSSVCSCCDYVCGGEFRPSHPGLL
ncbi:zona pellucida sperm-binding protein 3-like isoform X2 [Paramormyrops kingsleyae]|uniref:zona pellucida sperm-binding protein 3-like isoform X2 n=1 Tax=Paramormyrops kingsleyae TaxID=1676925 RepID=UPI000CD5EA8F|nr:zona pellucida sperm-binding protein 3-like isoform X2 [Paramormyrops kingsleyae]